MNTNRGVKIAVAWWDNFLWGTRPGQLVTGIFWDYENVPVPRDGGEAFLDGLYYFAQANEVAAAKVYAHAGIIPPDRLRQIGALPGFKLKMVKQAGPNAADESLIQSCMDILEDDEAINHVLLLTGDADFLALTDQLHDWEVRITHPRWLPDYMRNDWEKAPHIDFNSLVAAGRIPNF